MVLKISFTQEAEQQRKTLKSKIAEQIGTELRRMAPLLVKSQQTTGSFSPGGDADIHSRPIYKEVLENVTQEYEKENPTLNIKTKPDRDYSFVNIKCKLIAT